MEEERRVGESKLSLPKKCPLRCDDLFNKQFRDKVPAPIPTLTVGGELWMSLSAMEIQASELNIARAHGVVWTAGLGLGYFAMRCAAKKEVKEVHVVEQEKDVIDLFYQTHDRPLLQKIYIYHGDARKIIKRRKGDFCWMDTYQTLLPDEIPADGRFYQKHNEFTEYCFFGWELAMLWCLIDRAIKPYMLPGYYIDYLTRWKNTRLYPKGSEHDDGTTLDALVKEPLDVRFMKRAIKDACTLKYS